MGEGAFRGDHYTPEPHPTPAQVFGTIGLVLGAVAYMVCVILLLVGLLAH